MFGHIPNLLVYTRADILLDLCRHSKFPALDPIKRASRAGVTKWNEPRGTAPSMAKKKKTEKELTQAQPHQISLRVAHGPLV